MAERGHRYCYAEILMTEYNSVACERLQYLFNYKFFIAFCKKAKLQARIKPIALCSEIDKENSIEFPLDFLHYLYNYYMVCAMFSYTYHVAYHVMWCCDFLSYDCDYVWHLWHDTFPHSLLCSKSKIKGKEKKRKRKINNNLAVLPSHDTFVLSQKFK